MKNLQANQENEENKITQNKQIIKDGKIIFDEWQIITDAVNVSELPIGKVIVPFNMWLEFKDSLIKRKNIGIWLKADEEISQITGDLSYLPIIALEFPVFTDGRHYSTAAILRNTYKYEGEIRAIGDVLRDQLQAMWRVGFNAFAVRADKNINDALLGLSSLSSFYRFNRKIA